MDDSQDGIEVTEDVVLELGNQILSVLGSEEPITDLQPFMNDALYIELFKILFPQFPLDELQPGESFDEMADNIRALRQLLGEQVLDTDLSYISATAILEGDLNHLAQFLQILMQVIALLAEGEGEGDEEEESHRKSLKSKEDKKIDSSPDIPKSDTRKNKGGIELSSPEIDELDQEEKELEEKLMKQINQEPSRSKDEPIIKDEPMHADIDDSFDMDHEESPQFEPNNPIKEGKDDKIANSNKPKVDLFHDPLLPEDESIKHSAKKRQRAGSFSKNKEDDHDMEEDEAIAFDELGPEEKIVVLQQLYEEYIKDPDSFPEEQRILLEEELKDMIDKGLIEGFDDDSEESEEDERMKVKGKINFPSEPLPIKSDEDDKYEISKGEHELDVEEVKNTNKSDKKGIKSNSASSEKKQPKIKEVEKEEIKETKHDESEEHEEHEKEPDEEAQIIQDSRAQHEATETPEIDDNAKLELLQRMQQEQEAISRRITRRK